MDTPETRISVRPPALFHLKGICRAGKAFLLTKLKPLPKSISSVSRVT
jgi:hypothetical protein